MKTQQKKRQKSPLAGPLREVVYIFDHEGSQGGRYWRLVLACGHTVARSQPSNNRWTAIAHLLGHRPLNEIFAPKRAQCWSCETGLEHVDPWQTVKLYGGPQP